MENETPENITKRCSAHHPKYPEIQCSRKGGDCLDGEHIGIATMRDGYKEWVGWTAKASNKAARVDELPLEFKCNACGLVKPRESIIITFIKAEKFYYLRPRCKDCNNERERGHRRDWKRKYLQAWRKRNKQLNDSYWKGSERVREQSRMRAAKLWQEKHAAILIQGRLNRHGHRVTLKEAEALFERFGCCYPTRFGLTPTGLRECERIRSRMRKNKNRLRLSALDIRIMVYEDGLFITPKKQRQPYQAAAKRLRDWHRGRLQSAGRKNKRVVIPVK